MHLGIDTATEYASLALLDQDRLIFETSWHCGRNHSVELLPTLNFLMLKHQVDFASLEGIIVAHGPGSFNGLRVGISTAKGLALSLGIPVVGVSTLASAAYQHAASCLPICPIINARRGEIATALYQMTSTGWQQSLPEKIMTIDKLALQIKQPTLFCGEYLFEIAPQLRAKIKGMVIIPSSVNWIRRAGYLVELGQQLLANGKTGDPAELQANYLRRPAITKPKKKNINGGY